MKLVLGFFCSDDGSDVDDLRVENFVSRAITWSWIERYSY